MLLVIACLFYTSILQQAKIVCLVTVGIVSVLKEVLVASRIALESCWPCQELYIGVIEGVSRNPSIWWKDRKTDFRSRTQLTLRATTSHCESRLQRENTIGATTSYRISQKVEDPKRIQPNWKAMPTADCMTPQRKWQCFVCRLQRENNRFKNNTTPESIERNRDRWWRGE